METKSKYIITFNSSGRGDIIPAIVKRELKNGIFVNIYDTNTEILVQSEDVFNSFCHAILGVYLSESKNNLINYTFEEFVENRFPDNADECKKSHPQYFI